MILFQRLCGIFLLCLVGVSDVWANAPGEQEGIALESTRVIYPGSAKAGITFSVTNRTPYVYLLQSRVLPWGMSEPSTAPSEDERPPVVVVQPDSLPSTPFIVLPPLVRFAQHEKMTLRIRLIKNSLPTDRESIFNLALKAIPSQHKPLSGGEEGGSQMVLALQNNLKLFYRPEGLAEMSAEQRSAALRFSLQGAQLTINNPTPYYVTLGRVNIGGEQFELGQQRMLAPFTTASYDVVKRATTVSWRLINDRGEQTPELTQPLR